MARRRIRRAGVYIEGLEEVIEMVENMEDNSISFVDNASKEGTEVALKHAKRLVPVKSGNLKSKLQIAAEKKKRKTISYHRIKAPKVKYMFYVEVGTSKMSGKPFLRPAVDDNQSEINNAVVDKMLEGIDRAL